MCGNVYYTSGLIGSFMSMEFSRQEHWNGLPFPTLGDLPNRGIKPMSLAGRQIGRQILHHCATWEGHLLFFTDSFNRTIVIYSLRHST